MARPSGQGRRHDPPSQVHRLRGRRTAIEYALIAALISVFIIGSVVALGASLDGQFGSIAETTSDAQPPA